MYRCTWMFTGVSLIKWHEGLNCIKIFDSSFLFVAEDECSAAYYAAATGPVSVSREGLLPPAALYKGQCLLRVPTWEWRTGVVSVHQTLAGGGHCETVETGTVPLLKWGCLFQFFPLLCVKYILWEVYLKSCMYNIFSPDYVQVNSSLHVAQKTCLDIYQFQEANSFPRVQLKENWALMEQIVCKDKYWSMFSGPSGFLQIFSAIHCTCSF